MAKKLPRSVVTAIDGDSIMGIRAGDKSDHKFTGVWPVVVEDRVFARSWTQKPGGWYQTFRDDPRGIIQTRADKRVRIKAVSVKSERIRDLIEKAYAEKYATPGSKKYVRGFRTPKRRDTTTEFVPR